MENVIGIQMLDISVPAREKYQKLVYVPPPAPGSGSGVRLRGPAPGSGSGVRLRKSGSGGPEAAGMSSSSPLRGEEEGKVKLT